jgi:L-threonylcarbamoyladenylate synthase
MIRKEISKNPKEEELAEAVKVLKEGGLLVYPTDTVYGLAVDAFNIEAIGKLFVLKRRSQKPLPVIVPNMTTAKKIAEISKKQEQIMQKYWPGAITFVVKKKSVVPNALTLGLDTVGIRIPDSPIATMLARLLGNPITSTSANITGDKVCTTVDEVMRQFSGSESAPEFYLDADELTDLPPSTVVDLVGDAPKVLRKGPVAFPK